jgi:hypothetical protein
MKRASVAVFISFAGFALAQPAPHSLSPEDTEALREPLALGQRIIAAASKYSKPSDFAKMPNGPALLTQVPTIEILHAARDISDADMLLARRYRATLHPANQPLLSMETDRGELEFYGRGGVTLRSHT